jgi:hypothetical protein
MVAKRVSDRDWFAVLLTRQLLTKTRSAPVRVIAGVGPMVNVNSPEKSYMPQEDISDRQFCTVAGVNTGSSVSGHTPALASDAAATASMSASTSMEQDWK